MPAALKLILITICILIVLVVVLLIIVGIRLRDAAAKGYPTLDYSTDKIIGKGSAYRVLAIGDSTAFGLGADKVEDTYGYRIAEALSQSYQVTYRNRAVNGATTDKVANQLSGLQNFRPDIILLSVGANDVTHFRSPSRITADMIQLIDKLLNESSAQIFFANVPAFEGVDLLPVGLRDIAGWQARRANARLGKIFQDNPRVHLVPINQQTVSVFTSDSTNLFRDGYHPSSKGYGLWANVFLDQIGR